MFTTAFEEMTVNAFVVWDGKSGRAAAFDTGGSCDGMLELVRARGLVVEVILLTHVHGDHIFDLDRLKAGTGAVAWVSGRERLDGTEIFEDGKVWTVGGIEDRGAADERACGGGDDVCGGGVGAAGGGGG